MDKDFVKNAVKSYDHKCAVTKPSNSGCQRRIKIQRKRDDKIPTTPLSAETKTESIEKLRIKEILDNSSKRSFPKNSSESDDEFENFFSWKNTPVSLKFPIDSNDKVRDLQENRKLNLNSIQPHNLLPKFRKLETQNEIKSKSFKNNKNILRKLNSTLDRDKRIQKLNSYRNDDSSLEDFLEPVNDQKSQTPSSRNPDFQNETINKQTETPLQRAYASKNNREMLQELLKKNNEEIKRVSSILMNTDSSKEYSKKNLISQKSNKKFQDINFNNPIHPSYKLSENELNEADNNESEDSNEGIKKKKTWSLMNCFPNLRCHKKSKNKRKVT